MYKSKKGITSIFLAFLLTTVFSVSSYADALLDEIKARSAKIKEYKELLNNPDQVTRLAALDVMLKSDDTVMKNTAFTVGFSSDDEQVRSLALKHRLAGLNNLPLEAKVGEETKTLLLRIKEFNFETGKFQSNLNLSPPGTTRGAAVYGTTIRGDGYNGTFVLRLEDGGKLSGHVENSAGRYPVTAELM